MVVLRIVGLLVLQLSLAVPLFAADAAQPNIVLILAADLGFGDVRCYNDQSKVPTPHIDRLARKGMRFTDAHSPCTVRRRRSQAFKILRYSALKHRLAATHSAMRCLPDIGMWAFRD